MKKLKKYGVVLVATSACMFAGCGMLKKEEAVVEPEPIPEVTQIQVPAETPEPTAEPTAEPTTAPVVEVELGDNIYDYTVAIDGQVLKFPMMASELTNLGWECVDDDTQGVPSDRYGLITYKKGDVRPIFYVMNFNVNEAAVKDCAVVGVTLDDFSAKDAAIEIPGNIKIGTSTMEDVRQAFGTPSDVYEGDKYPYDTYKEDSYSSVKVKYSHENGDVVKEFEIKHFVEPESFVADEIDTEGVPEIVSTYVKPSAVEDDLYKYTVEYAGDCYALPAPVSEFIENGWVIKEDKSEATIDGSGSGKVTLVKDNQEFWTYVRNYDMNATSIENCYITEIKASKNGPNVSCLIGNGISLGDDESKLESLKGYTVEKKEQTGYNEYIISDERSLTYHYEFACWDGKITNIEIQYQPKVKDYRAEKGLN